MENLNTVVTVLFLTIKRPQPEIVTLGSVLGNHDFETVERRSGVAVADRRQVVDGVVIDGNVGVRTGVIRTMNICQLANHYLNSYSAN